MQNEHYKLGKKPAVHDSRTLRLADYVTSAMPPPPDSCDWTAENDREIGKDLWQMYANDRIGDCFRAGTLIRMADGTSRPIEQLRVLDVVLTAEGNHRKVLSTMVRHHEGELIRIVAWGHSHLKCTPEHPILTRRGYVPAKELRAGDWIAMPAKVAVQKTEICTQEHLLRSEMFRLRTSGNRKLAGGGVATITKAPETIRLTHGFGRLVGLFCAEGSTSHQTVRFTFGGHERHSLVKECCYFLKKELGIEARQQKLGNGAIDVVVCGKHWRLLFESLCAKGVANKTLHADVFSGQRDFLDGVLTGWLDGDGHYRRGCETGTTVSRNLAQDMFCIANLLGRTVSISGRQPKGKTRYRWSVCITDKNQNRARGESAHLGVSKCKSTGKWCAWGNKSGRSKNLGRYEDESEAARVADEWRKANDVLGSGKSVRDENNTLWRCVRRIEAEDYVGDVFNISVAGDQSYVAEGVGVHNCGPAGIAHQLTMWTATVDTPIVPTLDDVLKFYSAESGYDPATGANDNGVEMLSAMKRWRKEGMAGHKIAGFTAVDPRDQNTLATAIWLFGGVALGFRLPAKWQGATEWKAPSHIPAFGPWAPGSWGGHWVESGTYNKAGIRVLTWGGELDCSWYAQGAYGDEVYVPLSWDWVDRATRKAPNGISWEDLASDIEKRSGEKPDPLPGIPTPLPSGITTLLPAWLSDHVHVPARAGDFLSIG